jgi:hypothetical protein
MASPGDPLFFFDAAERGLVEQALKIIDQNSAE